MRRFQSALPLRFLFCSLLLVLVSACGGGSGDDDGRIRAQRSGVFIDSPVSGLAYNTPTRSGSTGNAGTLGSFNYLEGESVTFRLSCITLGTVPGQSVVSPRTLLSGQAAINLARVLLTLDADGNNSNGIEVGYVQIPSNLCAMDFAQFPESDFESFVEQLRNNGQLQRNQDPTAYGGAQTEDVVTPEYATNHLNCSEQGQTFANGSCGNQPALTISNVSRAEGDSGISQMIFTATLSTTSAQEVRVSYASADSNPVSATVGTDYQAASGTLVFPAGSTSQTFNVTINGDTTIEADETFVVNLSSPVNAVIVDGQGVGTITNDDAPQPDAPRLVINDVSAAEGNSGTTNFTFTVTLQNAQNAVGNVTVTASTQTDSGAPVNQQASAGTDYASTTQQLTLSSSTTTASFTVAVTGEAIVELDETFLVKLTAASGATITDDTGLGTITNDDMAPPTPELSINDVTLNESSAGTTNFVFTVTLTPNAQPVTVNFSTADGSTNPATGGAACNALTDYVSASGSLIFPASAATHTQSITVPVCGDLRVEADETFFVNLTAAGVTTVDGQGLGTIRNDDSIVPPSTLLRAGAAKRSLTPTQAQIDGIVEPRAFGGGEHLQKFNLGGFGINLGQNFPDPLGDIPGAATTTEPASRRVFTNHAGQNEDTNVRAFVIEQPGGDAVAFVMIDAIGAGNIIQNELKAAVIAATRDCGEQHNQPCFQPGNILFGQTHSHTAADLQGLWGGVPATWMDCDSSKFDLEGCGPEDNWTKGLYQLAAEAVKEAWDERQPAHLSFRQGHTVEFNNYRRPRIDPNAEADGTITVLTATEEDGTPIGNILQYNAHPTSVGDGNKPRTPHSEYIRGAMDWLESSSTGPGGTSLFYNGPIADASPSGSRSGCVNSEAGNSDPSAAKFGEVRCRGEGMADYLQHPQNVTTETELAPTLQARSVEVTLPVTNPAFLAIGLAGTFNRYYDFAELPVGEIPGLGPLATDLPQLTPVARTFVSRITLGGATGGLEIVTIPGETTNTFGNYIRDLAQTNVMLLGLTHNSFGYIIPEDEFSYVDQTGGDGLVVPFTGYEESVSLGPLTAPLLRIEGYNMLFDAPGEQYVPPMLAACLDQPGSGTCVTTTLQNRFNLLLNGMQICLASGLGADGCPFRTTIGFIDGLLEILAEGCNDVGGPEEFCSLFGQGRETLQTLAGIGAGGSEPPPPPAADGDEPQGIAGCLLTQDPALCQAAVESLQGLQDCPTDETGLNCAFNVVYDAVGVGDAADAISGLIAMCNDSPAAPVCEAIRSSGGAPDRVVVASESLRRGDLVITAGSPVMPSAKSTDGNVNDWTGTSPRIGGTEIYSKGEHIYTDFLFDAFGADDGDDARRLAVLTMLGQVNSRTERVDALQQAGGDQLGVPQPAGSRADHYGDAANREDGLDLTEVRWAADTTDLSFLARVAKLENASNYVVLILADTDATSGMTGLNAGLKTSTFDRAVVLSGAGGQLINLTNGASSSLGSGAVAISATGYTNAVEARIPRSALARIDGTIRVAVMSARKVGNSYIPSNVAYRFDEPVTIYSERAQAMSLFAGNVDGFTATIALNDLAGGKTQTARPGPGYHERQVPSGDNISVESDSENGRLQPYGLFVPSSPAMNAMNQIRLTFWLHYRGGKAHSGAAWTPRLITQLGEEQGNIVVTPRGRGTSTWYTTRAHQDFFEVFADIAGTGLLKQYAAENLPAGHGFGATGLFNIDPARVYLSGYSMGGYATYLLGGLYPDLFAAGYSTSGAVTQGAWTGVGPDDAQCDASAQNIPGLDETGNLCFIEANNGRANAQLNYRILDNTRHVPLVIHHGTNDELALTPGAVRMGQRLLELQYRYDMTLFLGYEHFTQAIMDEWRDGAQFLNLYARPENPRAVTYKLVPALVKAINEVQLNGLNDGQPFQFHPDGAYWVDGLVVRDGTDGSDPSRYGQIDAVSQALPASSYVPVPRTGAAIDAENPYVSTPVYSPGNHTTPYVRHGLEWQAIGDEPTSNRFSATLTNLDEATFDAGRMGLNFASRIDGSLQSDGIATLTLTHINMPMTLCQGGEDGVNVNDAAFVNLTTGSNAVYLLPGHDQVCGEAPSTPASSGGVMGLLSDLLTDLGNFLAALTSGNPEAALEALQVAVLNLYGNVVGLVVSDPNASVIATLEHGVNNPTDSEGLLADIENLINGYLQDDAVNVRAGVGVVDMTPDVGYGAGQYSDTTDIFDGLAGGDIDPYLTHKKQKTSYGVQSRLTARAIVVEGANGKRIVLLKSDNYLAQDNLIRRVAQILEANGSSIAYQQILYHVTHAHSTTYSSTLAAGVAAFQDVYDARFFENQARKLAQAILTAEANLKPARMGATTVRHKIFKGNIMGPTSADDGTPAGYPSEYGDHGLAVMRFDEVNAQGAFVKPIAVWVNWGEHPEGLDGYDLHSADYLAALERFVQRDLNAPLVFSQGDVGSAEKSGNEQQRLRDDATVCNDEPGETCPVGQGVLRDWNHKGYVQNERNVRYLADGIVKGWKVIGGELPVDPVATGIPPNNYVPEVQVAMSSDFPVDYRNGWVPGPLSHPYPAVSNCRTEPTVAGHTGVPVAGLPDCARDFEGFEFPPGSNPVSDQLAMIYATMKAEGLPVPEHYDVPSFGALEENARLKLQAFRLGEVLLASCACEAQVDLILNFESRADDVANNIYDGFDWACVAEDRGLLPRNAAFAAACNLQRQQHFDVAEFPTPVPGNIADAAKLARMRAQVHNDAAGWDAPEYVPFANTEPANPAEIKGNFSKEELPASRGYKLAIGIGHAGDYNGYTVSYREYMRGDHYRKALTAYGAHTADYMVTRMVRMAGAMKGAPELVPELLDAVAQADEARQVALSLAHGQVTKAAYDTWLAVLPPDVGPATVRAQPANIPLFSAATFRWRGGGTQVDNPRVKVQQQQANGSWKDFADQTGEVQTRVHWPQGIPGVVTTYTGQFAWEWTANFEAYQAFPARLGSTPLGNYRFVVNGCINDDLPGSLQRRAESVVRADACPGGARPYELASDPFAVTAAVATPRSYTSVFPFIVDTGNTRICNTCSFRPWATH